jgi:hypothetical protein
MGFMVLDVFTHVETWKINLMNLIYVLNIANKVAVFCGYLHSLWFKAVTRRCEQFVTLCANMWFLSCGVAAPNVFEYGGCISSDFYVYHAIVE